MVLLPTLIPPGERTAFSFGAVGLVTELEGTAKLIRQNQSFGTPVLIDVGVKVKSLSLGKREHIAVVDSGVKSPPVVCQQRGTGACDETRATIFETPSKELAAKGIRPTESDRPLDVVRRGSRDVYAGIRLDQFDGPGQVLPTHERKFEASNWPRNVRRYSAD
jgi:hypothetical protein